ncbi:MAG: PAS-domain containing protein [Granulosicoccus sp.]|nr:PAS-domain containing protein [Granulosicoccus sp.]
MTPTSNTDSELHGMQAGVEALSEGFALFNDADELVYCNSAFRKLYPDLTNFLAPGVSWALFLEEAKRRRGAAELDQLDAHLNSGFEVPLILEVSNRGMGWHRMGIHPAADGGFVLTDADVTEQHQAHEIIEHADDLMRSILDACASRIVLCRLADASILYRTPSWLQAFGDASDIKSVFTDPLAYTDLLTDILSSDRVDDRELSMARADGERFPARIFARMIDYQGELALVVSAEDLTQLHKQRDQIILTNQRVLDAIEALDQGFVLYDADHRLLMANQRYMDINQPIGDVLKPGTHNTVIVEQSKAVGHEPLAAGWPQKDEEQIAADYEFHLNQEQTFSVSRKVTSDGGFVIAWRDVTEQKATQKELASRRETAFQNEKLTALGQLLAGVAHELNNPLSVIVGHAMMLQDEVADPDTLEGVEKISRSAERCAKIVKTFLAMARQKPTQLISTDLNDVIGLALEIASYSMRQSGVTVELLLGENLPQVEVDEDQVTQVFINLMINAEQALVNAKNEPRLQLVTIYDAELAQVIAYVSDNGTGIPEAQKSRIFEPFYTTKAVGEGTGVGLALSHRIIDSHGGQLQLIDSKLGGATFAVALPASNKQLEKRAKELTLSEERALTVMVVEDEPDVASIMHKLLLKMGVSAVVASNAEEGLQLLENNIHIDFILCDLRMPGMGGLAMLGEVERRWPDFSDRFVFLTGDAISDDARIIRERATHQIIEKPISADELQSLVKSMQNISTSGTGPETTS